RRGHRGAPAGARATRQHGRATNRAQHAGRGAARGAAGALPTRDLDGGRGEPTADGRTGAADARGARTAGAAVGTGGRGDTGATPVSEPGGRFILERYASLLPVTPQTPLVTLGEGGTPLVPSRAIGPALGLEALYFKLEYTNPTGSFKDRG